MRIRNRFIVYLFLIGCCLLVSRMGHAFDSWVNQSTNTVNAVTTSRIGTSRAGDMLGAVIINKLGTGQQTLTVYDSSASATNSFGVIDLSTGITGGAGYAPREYIYNVRVSSGLTFTLGGVGSGADITILWQSMRAN